MKKRFCETCNVKLGPCFFELFNHGEAYLIFEDGHMYCWPCAEIVKRSRRCDVGWSKTERTAIDRPYAEFDKEIQQAAEKNDGGKEDGTGKERESPQ